MFQIQNLAALFLSKKQRIYKTNKNIYISNQIQSNLDILLHYKLLHPINVDPHLFPSSKIKIVRSRMKQRIKIPLQEGKLSKFKRRARARTRLLLCPRVQKGISALAHASSNYSQLICPLDSPRYCQLSFARPSKFLHSLAHSYILYTTRTRLARMN